MTDMRRMQVGQLVDFCIDYNERQKQTAQQTEKEEQRGRKRKATQADINAFFG